MTLDIINPPSLGRPRGFSHGVLAPAGVRLLAVAGQTAPKEATFVAQFDRALANVLEVVRAAGGRAAHVTRMTVYVTDLEAYRASRSQLSDVWKRQMGTHYPAMALLAVSGLVDDGAVVEIAADAVIEMEQR